MRSKMFILTLILFAFLYCEHKKPNYTSGWITFYFFVIKPAQDRAIQCSQPDAISLEYTPYYCLNAKVTEGLIFDADSLVGIKTDTLGPGQTFFCQCGQNYSISFWKKGDKIEDNPSSNPSLTLIFAFPTKSYPKQISLNYKTHYNQPDNLYCITECPVNSGKFQYQFLKIR